MKPTFSMLRSGFARKLFLLVAVCALLPIGGLAYISLRQVYGNLEEQAQQRLRHASKNVGMNVYNGVRAMVDDLEILPVLIPAGSSPAPSPAAGSTAIRHLKRSFLAAAWIRDGRPPRSLFGPPCPLPPDTEPVRRHLAEGNPVVFLPPHEGTSARIFLASSARDGGGRSGMLVAEVNPEPLWDRARSAIPGTIEVDILTEEGIPLFGTRPVTESALGAVREAWKRSSSGLVRWNAGGSSFLGEFWSIFLKGRFQCANWTVVASLPSEEIFGPVREFTRVFRLLLALTGAIIVLITGVQIRRNLAPLRQLIEGTGHISRGEFGTRVEIRSRDEFEELARSFNAMAEKLESQFRAMRESNRRMEREIAERKEAEREKALLGMAVEQVAESILITDPRGTIQYANPAFERSTGFRREEVVGEEIRALVSEDLDRARIREIRHAWVRGEVWTGRIPARTKDGSRLMEELILSPVRDDAGRVVHYVVGKRDVTSQVQLEERLRHAQKMEAVGKLTGGIAHEFNNLLTAILGYSGILLGALKPDDPGSKEVTGIRDAGERASHLVRQLLTFSRKQVAEPKPVDLNGVLSGIDMMLTRLIPETVRLVRIPGERLRRVRGDPSQIEVAIMNLVANARDAMPGGGTLTIETANRPGGDPAGPEAHVTLKVTDTGCGMDGETKARIFEPFFTTKAPGKGTGLGLATVYGIVQQHGGTIEVTSEPETGTTFLIDFPATEAGHDDAVRPEPQRCEPAVGTETVLLAEDEPLIRDIARTVLEERGYKVLEAEDGREALEIGNGYPGPIHLLLTDLVMPHLGGREVAERMRSIRPEIRTLFMSGYLEDATLVQDGSRFGVAFLQKPFRPETLSRAVRGLMDAGRGEAAH